MRSRTWSTAAAICSGAAARARSVSSISRRTVIMSLMAPVRASSAITRPERASSQAAMSAW